MKNFVVFGTQRSGTTLLIKLLDSHPDITCFNELLLNYYNYHQKPGQLHMIDCWKNNKIKVNINMQEYINYVYDTTQKVKAIGFNLMLSHFQAYPEVEKILSNLDTKYIFIFRKNFLQTLISRSRLGLLSPYRFGSDEEEKAKEMRKIQISLNIKDLIKALECIEEQDIEMQEIIAKKKLEYTIIDYDDLSNNHNCQSIKKVLSMLEVNTNIDLHSTFKKTGPNSLKNAVTNYDEIIKVLQQSKYRDLIY